ncbi:MAG: FtsQ-type POTRA domain-containing protein [Deltaproteobacteria bacterium]|jgi:cell division septal protein FtsQ|nr:FtsQ-type POTRA domain-containing protein [Deltaproteobacteria bacterium]
MARYQGRYKRFQPGRRTRNADRILPDPQPGLRRRFTGELKKPKNRLRNFFFKPETANVPAGRKPPAGLAWTEVLGRAVKLTLMGLAGFAVLLIISVLMVGGYLYLSKSDYFAVRYLKIAGLSHLTRDEVLTAAGLDRPINNLTFDLKAAERSLGSLAWVSEAHISRTLPDGLLVEVTEFRPKALVNMDQLYYLDARGVPFKKLDLGEKADLPIISGFSMDELVAGGPLVLEALHEVFQLMDILAVRTDEFRLDNISEFNYDHDLGLKIYTRRSGLKLWVGFGSYLEKFRRLGRVMAHLKLTGQAAGLADIRLETSPRVVLRYSQGSFGQDS